MATAARVKHLSATSITWSHSLLYMPEEYINGGVYTSAEALGRKLGKISKCLLDKPKKSVLHKQSKSVVVWAREADECVWSSRNAHPTLLLSHFSLSPTLTMLFYGWSRVREFSSVNSTEQMSSQSWEEGRPFFHNNYLWWGHTLHQTCFLSLFHAAYAIKAYLKT